MARFTVVLVHIALTTLLTVNADAFAGAFASRSADAREQSGQHPDPRAEQLPTTDQTEARLLENLDQPLEEQAGAAEPFKASAALVQR